MQTFPFTLLCDQSLHFHCKQLNYHEVAKRSNGQHAFIPSETAEPENTSLQMNISLVFLVIFSPSALGTRDAKTSAPFCDCTHSA